MVFWPSLQMISHVSYQTSYEFLLQSYSLCSKSPKWCSLSTPVHSVIHAYSQATLPTNILNDCPSENACFIHVTVFVFSPQIHALQNKEVVAFNKFRMYSLVSIKRVGTFILFHPCCQGRIQNFDLAGARPRLHDIPLIDTTVVT